MTAAHRATLLAALSVLLTSTAFFRVYEDAAWVLPVVGAVLAVAAAGALSRRARVALALQPAVAAVIVGGYVALVYARETLGPVVLPGAATAQRIGALIGEGLLDVETQSAPVTTSNGLVLLAVLGAAAVAALVDLVAVSLRRPALAGLPLLALLAVPSGTLEGGVGVGPFALGAIGWLLLLLDDSRGRVDRWGTALRSRGTRAPLEETSLGRVGRRIGVAALGVAVVVPALVPGLEARVFDGGSGGGFGGSRTTVTYNPITELGGQLRLPEPRPLLVYRTDDTSPDYLRLTTLDRFADDSGWSSSELSADVREDVVSEGIPLPAAVRAATTRPVRTAVRVQNLAGPWLPVPAVPRQVDIEGPWLWDDGNDTVFSTRVDVQDVSDTYQVSGVRVTPDPATLRRGQQVPEDVAGLAQAPEVSPYVRDLTARVVRDAPTTYDRVVALQQYFRTPSNGFVYDEDTDVPGIDAPNALEEFLRGRRGFCEQYASAMAAMVRVLGVPARVAVGFTPGSRQPDGTYQVTTNEAHAWPEVWFADAGWVRFEPTPRDEQVVTPAYSVPPVAEDDPAAAPQTTPTEQAAAPAPAPDDPALDRRFEGEADLGADAGPERRVTPARTAAVLALLLLLVAPAALAGVRRRLLWRDAGPRAAWAHVVEDAGDVGLRFRPSDSPQTAAGRLLASRPMPEEAASALRRLAGQVEQARYARPDAVAPVTSAELRREVALVRSGLLATAAPRTRWRARLLPASALGWAASAVGRAIADGLDRVDDLASAVGRLRRTRRRPA